MKTETKLFWTKIAKGVLAFANRILSPLNFALVVKMRKCGWKRPRFVNDYDYIRFSQMELCAREIYERNIQGAVAELGVYRGDFASKINAAFPDRTLYLFDTFEGFSKNDIKTERVRNFSKGKENDFCDTSVEFVLKKMSHKKNCIIKKGFFPESASGVNERFAFVSIDCDLYEPILSGLRWFWKNMGGGGIFLSTTTTTASIKERTPQLTNFFWKRPKRDFSRSQTKQAQL